MELSHVIDDAETTRTHALRTLQRQEQLLSHALHALRDGSHATADEFVSRVRDTLTKEIAYLEAHPTAP